MGENLTLQPSSPSTKSVFKKPFSTFNRNVLLARNLNPTTQEEKELYNEIQEEFRKISAKEWSAMDEIDAPLIDDHRPIVSYSMEIRREVEEAYEDTKAENIDEEDVLEVSEAFLRRTIRAVSLLISLFSRWRVSEIDS